MKTEDIANHGIIKKEDRQYTAKPQKHNWEEEVEQAQTREEYRKLHVDPYIGLQKKTFTKKDPVSGKSIVITIHEIKRVEEMLKTIVTAKTGGNDLFVNNPISFLGWSPMAFDGTFRKEEGNDIPNRQYSPERSLHDQIAKNIIAQNELT